MTIDVWDSIVNSLTAVGTLGAVLVAVVVAGRDSKRVARADERAARADERAERAEERTARAEAAREAERARQDTERAAALEVEQAERHRAQALLVIAWVHHADPSDLTGRVPGETQLVDRTYHLSVGNHSDAPVFDVSVDLMNPLNKVVEVRDRLAVPVLAPGATSGIALGKPLAERGMDIALVRFRDLRGTWWRRHQSGRLEETNRDGVPLPPSA